MLGDITYVVMKGSAMWTPSIVTNWVNSWLEYFGFLQRRGNLVILGLDNAGKTTMLGLLSTGKVEFVYF